MWFECGMCCNTLQHTATHCNTLQHTATHCNTLQHTATHTLACDLNAACVCKIARERFSFFWMQFLFVCLLLCLVRLSHTCTRARIPLFVQNMTHEQGVSHSSCTNVLSHSKLHSRHIQKCHKSFLVQSHSNATFMPHSNSLVTFKCHTSRCARTSRVL